MVNALYKGKLFDASHGTYEDPELFTLLAYHSIEGFEPYKNKYFKEVHSHELEDYYEFEFYALVQGIKCQVMNVFIEEKEMRVINSGYELKKFYVPEHLFDQSDYVYRIPITEGSLFYLEVSHFEKPDFKKYMGYQTFEYTYEEFMRCYRKEVLDRA